VAVEAARAATGAAAASTAAAEPPPLARAVSSPAKVSSVAGSAERAAAAASRFDAKHPADDGAARRARFTFALVFRSAPADGAAARAALDGARRVLEGALTARWDAFRCDRVWVELQRGSAPPPAELALFLRTLPTAVPLDALYPSLSALRRLRLPWASLLDALGGAGGSLLRPCRWGDGGEAAAAAALSSAEGAAAAAAADTAMVTASAAAAATEHLVLLGEARGGLLVHCASSGASFRATVCSVKRIVRRDELLTEESEEVARGVAAWLWAQLVGGTPTTPAVMSAADAAAAHRGQHRF